MSAFKRFGPGDQIDNVLVLEPKWDLASGTFGWKGSPEGSASVSLYGGYSRATGSSGFGIVQEYEFQRTIQGTDSFGKLHRSGPITASVNYVYATSNELSLTERTEIRWGYEHWKTVQRLYDYYSRRDPDYITASYDHYCVFFKSGSQNIISYPDRSNFSPTRHICLPTGSFTLEAWVKPFVSGTPGNDMTIMSRARSFKLKIDGDSNRLVFATYNGTSTTVPSYVTTGSTAVVPGEWHHVAVTSDGVADISMYLDNVNQSAVAATATLTLPVAYTGSFHIGAEFGGTTQTQGIGVNQRRWESLTNTPRGLLGTVFHGFIGEVRVWGVKRTAAQLSASYNTRLTGSSLNAPLLAQFRLSEGPLANCLSSTDPTGGQASFPTITPSQGSGTINWAVVHQTQIGQIDVNTVGVMPEQAFLFKFLDRNGPMWHPNDNNQFYLPKELAVAEMSGTGWGPYRSADVQRMHIINVPAGMYGRRIVPGSVRVTDRAFSDPTYRIVRTLVDDGRGGLYLSGSAVSCSFALSATTMSLAPSTPQYDGVVWNKVGNVFYDEGLIVIKDPSLLDFGHSGDQVSAHPDDLLQVEFRGTSRVPVKTLMCRIDSGDLNASLNPTFYNTEEDGDRVPRYPSGSIYVTTVGIYNSDRELVGVARLAEPLRVRPRDRMNVKLRMDF